MRMKALNYSDRLAQHHCQKTAWQQQTAMALLSKAFPTTQPAPDCQQSTVATPNGRISPLAPLSYASALKRVGPKGGKTTVAPKYALPHTRPTV